MQEIGAQALLVTSAANLLVGVIVGFLGVSQGGRALPRELGPLVTAIVVAGRSGAVGLRLGDRHHERVGGNRRFAVHGV